MTAIMLTIRILTSPKISVEEVREDLDKLKWVFEVLPIKIEEVDVQFGEKYVK